MANTRSGGKVEPAATAKVQTGGGSLARGGKDLPRGKTRSGTLFTRQSRGNYASLAELKKAHKKIFSLDSTFCLLERPISGRRGGLAEAVLRVSAKAHEDSVRKDLARAGTLLFDLYPQSTIFCHVTANAVLVSATSKSYSIYFGQRFSPNSRHVNYGQTFDEAGQELSKAGVYQLQDPSDLVRLPTKFPPEHFRSIFSGNFGSSAVRVDRLSNLVYLFSKGLKDYESERTTGQKWVDLF